MLTGGESQIDDGKQQIPFQGLFAFNEKGKSINCFSRTFTLAKKRIFKDLRDWNISITNGRLIFFYFFRFKNTKVLRTFETVIFRIFLSSLHYVEFCHPSIFVNVFFLSIHAKDMIFVKKITIFSISPLVTFW
jgi:hypothetical protein